MALQVTVRLSQIGDVDDLDARLERGAPTTTRDLITSDIMNAINDASLPYGWVSHPSNVTIEICDE